MISYPKVPHQYHSWANPEIFDLDDTIWLEKLDGSNGRIMVYDERFHEQYLDTVLELTPSDGDIIIGTKSQSQIYLAQTVHDSSDKKGFIEHLAKYALQLSKEDMKHVNTLADGPVVFFVENMVPHTLRGYYTGNSTVPHLLCFDAAIDTETIRKQPNNPAEQSFKGFVTWGTVKQWCDKIGLQTVPEVSPVHSPDNIPQSKYMNDIAEGVVARNDRTQDRVKIVRPDLQEKSQQTFGFNKTQVDTPEEKIVAMFCTNARINKQLVPLLSEHDQLSLTEYTPDQSQELFQLNNTLSQNVYDDIWAEEFDQLKELNMSFNPSEIKPLIAKRCIGYLRRIHAGAEWTGKHPLEVYFN